MPNVVFTPTLYTKLTLVSLGRRLKVARNLSAEYSKEFGKKTGKIGNKYNVRKPQRFEGTDGLAYNPEPLTNTSVELVVDQVSGVHFEWDAIGKTLDLDYIMEKYAEPAAIALSSKINRRAAEYVAKRTFNSVGTPGTDPTSLLTYLNAGDKLVELGLPENMEDDLACIINRRMSSSFIDGSKALFSNDSIISAQHKNGKVSNQLGYRWETDQTLYVHTVGAWASGTNPLVNGANQTADGGNNAEMTLNTDTWTANTSQLKEGDVFTINGVNSVHPQTRQDTGSSQQFVVREDLTANGAGQKAVKIFPAITPSGQYQNVTAAPADNAVITVVGNAGTSTTQGFLLHENAFAFMTVPLDVPSDAGAVVSQQTDSDTGLAITMLRQLDGKTMTTINRFDCLYGFGKLYPEMACRIQGR